LVSKIKSEPGLIFGTSYRTKTYIFLFFYFLINLINLKLFLKNQIRNQIPCTVLCENKINMFDLFFEKRILKLGATYQQFNQKLTSGSSLGYSELDWDEGLYPPPQIF